MKNEKLKIHMKLATGTGELKLEISRKTCWQGFLIFNFLIFYF
jgi:hypothetical protein